MPPPYCSSNELASGASRKTRLPSMRVMTRSKRMFIVSGIPGRIAVERLVHADRFDPGSRCSAARRERCRRPPARHVESTRKLVAPAGTTLSIMLRFGLPVNDGEPVPSTSISGRCAGAAAVQHGVARVAADAAQHDAARADGELRADVVVPGLQAAPRRESHWPSGMRGHGVDRRLDVGRVVAGDRAKR